MAETRVQIAYHFKFDPAQAKAGGAAAIPEEITRTVAVGDAVIPEKISSRLLSLEDRAAIAAEMDKQILETQRTAKPLGGESAVPAQTEEEESAF